MKVPMSGGGARYYQRDKEELNEAIQNVLQHGHWVMGPEVPAFEQELAAYCDVKYSVAVHSGTSSLHISLLAAGVGPGDEVLTVANADLATSLAVLHTGATLKWVDIDGETFNMDPDSLAEKLSPETRAVIVAHMYGAPADMDALREVIGDRDDVALIEDLSLALGATYKGRKTGSLGDLGGSSLAAGKILGVLGSGGAIITRDEYYYRRANQVRHYGRIESPYWHDDPLPPLEGTPGMVTLGMNERLDTLQAAVARVKLRHLERDLGQRRATAAIYDYYLADAPCMPQRVLPDCVSSYRVYVLRVEAAIRAAFLARLRERGIDAGLQYVPPDHLHPYFVERGAKPGMLPTTEAVADSLICIPCHPNLSIDQVLYAAETVRDTLKEMA